MQEDISTGVRAQLAQTYQAEVHICSVRVCVCLALRCCDPSLQLEQLKLMGIKDELLALQVLQATEGDVNSTAEILFQGQQ